MKKHHNMRKWLVGAAAVASLTATSRTMAYWAIDVSSQGSYNYTTPYTTGTTPSGPGWTSWYWEAWFSFSFAYSPNYVRANYSGEAWASTSLYRATTTSPTYAYGYAYAYAYAYWRWYGAGGSASPITARMQMYLTGSVDTSGSAATTGAGSSCSTTSYGTANGESYAYYGGGSSAYGWARAWGTATSGSPGSSTLTGAGVTWSGPSTSSGIGYYNASANYTVYLDVLHTSPWGLSSIYAQAKGAVFARSQVSGTWSPTGGDNMGGSNAHSQSSGWSQVSVSW